MFRGGFKKTKGTLPCFSDLDLMCLSFDRNDLNSFINNKSVRTDTWLGIKPLCFSSGNGGLLSLVSFFFQAV